MTDLDIINKFKDKKQIKYFIFDKLWPEEYKYLINRFNDSHSLKESLYRILYNIDIIPKCPICGKNCKFDYRENLHRIYSITCGDKECINKNWNNKQHEFSLNKYGVDNVFQAEEIKNKIKETSIKRYGVDHPFKNEKIKEKFKNTCFKKYGVEWFCYTEKNKLAVNSKEAKEKEIETKRKNGTLNSSKLEEESKNILCNKFKEVKTQYKSKQYPFYCDFYIPNLDLYIECNYHWTHGFKPYEGTKDDNIILNIWKTANKTYYNNAIETWTKRDVNKRNIAKKNNLNWIEFFNIQELKEWINNYEKFSTIHI